MLFKTLKALEVTPNPDEMFGDFGSRRHSIVEVTINELLLHLDVEFRNDEDDGFRCWSRFLLSDAAQVLQLLGSRDVVEARIHLQAAKDNSNDSDYSIVRVKKILACTTGDGRNLFEYQLVDGNSQVDMDYEGDPIVSREIVYFEQ